jgi:polyhydroxyalkanoate synthesis repressor PhaR
MDSRTVVIKKYENRRLYDTRNSRYINLDEVAHMVQIGYNVQVVDAATGEDLTRVVLTQIIADQAKAPDSVFPLDVLRQMVAATGRATQEGTLQYMKAVLDMYQNAFRAMTPTPSPFEFVRRPAAAAPETAVADRPSAAAEAHNEVNELKRRLADLESRLAGTPGRKKPSSRKPRKKR